MDKFINTLNEKDPNHWCILFAAGMRGNALARILAAHKESWWDNELMNYNSDPDLELPLQLSENQSSFLPRPGHDFSTTYLAPDTCLNVSGGNMNIIKKILIKRQNFLDITNKEDENRDKYFFTLSHPFPHWRVSRYIHIYASKQNSKRPYNITEPIDDKNVINVDISKLFSYNRNEFNEEYIKLLNKFDFSALFTTVRNFILQMLDRESSFDKYNSVLKINSASMKQIKR